MCHTYTKKFCSHSNTTSQSFFVFGLVIFTVWDNFGMVSKNFSIILNWFEFNDSTNWDNSFWVQSAAAQDSSSEYTWSTHDAIKSNVSSTVTSDGVEKLFLIN